MKPIKYNFKFLVWTESSIGYCFNYFLNIRKTPIQKKQFINGESWFFYILEIVLNNSFVIYNKSGFINKDLKLK